MIYKHLNFIGVSKGANKVVSNFDVEKMFPKSQAIIWFISLLSETKCDWINYLIHFKYKRYKVAKKLEKGSFKYAKIIYKILPTVCIGKWY